MPHLGKQITIRRPKEGNVVLRFPFRLTLTSSLCLQLLVPALMMVPCWPVMGQEEPTSIQQQTPVAAVTPVPGPTMMPGEVVSVPLSLSIAELSSGKVEHPTFSRNTLKVRLQDGSEVEATATKEQMEAALKGKTKVLLKVVADSGWQVVSLDAPPTQEGDKDGGEELTESGIRGRFLQWGSDKPAVHAVVQLAEYKELNGMFGTSLSERTKGLNAKTDSEGRFLIRGVPPGKWAFLARNLEPVRTSDGRIVWAEVKEGAFVIVDVGDILLR